MAQFEKKTHPLLALDFDGTLWDSAHECFVLTREAYQKLGWKIPRVKNLERKFMQGRPYVRIGAEFHLLLKWIQEHPHRNPSLLSPEDAETLRTPDVHTAVFEETFYHLRDEWRKKRLRAWCNLQKPYPGILKQLAALQKHFLHVVIATTKDSESVHRLLTPYHIRLDVIGREQTVNKPEQMEILSRKFEVPKERILFVDDLLDQVKQVQAVGVKVALAGWGYNTKEQRTEASHLHIPVLRLNTMAAALTRL